MRRREAAAAQEDEGFVVVRPTAAAPLRTKGLQILQQVVDPDRVSEQKSTKRGETGESSDL